MARPILMSLLAVAALIVTACGDHANQSAAAPPPPSHESHQLSDTPSEQSKMVCADEAQHEISLSLQLELSQPVRPTWSDHQYTCRYVYPVGTIALSVKELADANSATAYFATARSHLDQPLAVTGLGEDAYSEPDGSLVVRKDFLVLRIDASGLPHHFGQPPLSRIEAARRVGADIMTCWRELS